MDGNCYGILRDGGWENVGYEQYEQIREYITLEMKVRFIEYERTRRTLEKSLSKT